MLSLTTGHRLFFIRKIHFLQFLSYNSGEERRMIGDIIMAENLTYTRCGDYYIPDINFPTPNLLNGTAFHEGRIHISKNIARFCIAS